MTINQNKQNINKVDIDSRLQIEFLLDIEIVEKDDVRDVIEGLKRSHVVPLSHKGILSPCGTMSPKTLPARYFYDSRGSQLFEQICQIPEYYPTRTEAGILQQYAADIAKITDEIALVELGSGSSTKTRLLLDAYQDFSSPLYYTPVDVSGSILKESAHGLLMDYSNLKIQGKVATYAQALKQLQTSFLDKRMIVFLGSSIGNFNPTECDRFIEEVTAALNTGDYFLLGIDLQKSSEILEAAYNDTQGVTAAFNLNMLQHLNNRFDGNFNLDLFKHQAIYNQAANQIEMYLISQQAHSVSLKTLDLIVNFAKGEGILTEISRKFNIKQMQTYLGSKGLQLVQSYTDSQQWFGLLLCQKI